VIKPKLLSSNFWGSLLRKNVKDEQPVTREVKETLKNIIPVATAVAKKATIDFRELREALYIPNLKEIIPGRLFVGGAPSVNDENALKNLGGKLAIIDVRGRSDTMAKKCKNCGIKHMHIPDMDENISQIASQIKKNNLPTLVHCHGGGTVSHFSKDLKNKLGSF